MALDERLLEILVCPVCRADVEHKERRKVVICVGCSRTYPVREGIPVMLPEEATVPRGRA